MDDERSENLKTRAADMLTERRDTHIGMRGEGLSIREIASVTGWSIATVHADLTGEESAPTASQEPATSALTDAYIRSQVRPEAPTDGDEYIRSRTARKPRAQQVVDRLLGEYPTDEGEGDE